MSEIRCPQCNVANPSDAHYCSWCGALLPGSASSPDGMASIDDAQAAAAAEQLTRVETQLNKILIGRYRVESELGRGGFGAVYKAWDINLERPCAVKENLNTSTAAQRQFAREATVLANLTHPNLPRVTDHFSIPEQGQDLVMDFVEGDDLASMLRRQKTLPIGQCLNWIIQIADALVYLHSRHPAVFHRDIKPSNIRVTPDDRAMLVDFGLVKMSDPVMKTTMGARALTPGYAPPEQYGMGRTDGRSDIYALGATLYKLLTTRNPPESIHRATGEQITPPSQSNPLISPRLSQVVEKAMALDPQQRYQSAAEFKSDLQACLLPAQPVLFARDAPVISVSAASAGTAVRSVHETAPTGEPRRIPWLWIGLGLTALALILCFTLGGGSLALLGMRGSRASTHTPTIQGLGLQASSTPTPDLTTPLPDTPVPASAVPTLLPVVHSKDPSTYVQMDIYQPDTLDPAMDYETSGLQVIQNLYDTLIFYRREEPSVFILQLALEVPTLENGAISQDGLTYLFKIRPGVRFHDGTLLIAQDVVYTFQRNILQGGSSSPMWMLTEPVFGVGVYDVAELVDPALVDNPDGLKDADTGRLLEICQRLQQAIYTDPEGQMVIFHLAQPWAPFLASLTNGWGSIRSKAWTIANGGWDGDCQTWQDYYGRSLDQLNETPLGSGAMGTGPYRLESWTKDEQIILKANQGYWRTEPAWPGGPTGAPVLQTVIIRYQRDFAGRLAALQDGEADSTRVTSNVEWPDLDSLTAQVCIFTDQDCQPSQNPAAPLEMIRGFPVAGREGDIFMNWKINAQDGNDLIGSAQLDGEGVPPDFFSNVHVRRAFQYCFNDDTYLREIMQGEGLRSATVMLPEMIGYDAAAPQYTYDLARCQDEFRQAIFGGSSVWEAGFALKLPYAQDNRPDQKIAEIFAHELTSLNPNFKIAAVGLESDDYNQRYRDGRLPIFSKNWLEDIHDPHNWVVPYTIGNFSRQLNLPADLIHRFEEIIDRGVTEPDPEARGNIYREFNLLFYDQAPVILMYLSIDRQYQQRWVRGWYNNPLYPGLYYYVLGKD